MHFSQPFICPSFLLKWRYDSAVFLAYTWNILFHLYIDPVLNNETNLVNPFFLPHFSIKLHAFGFLSASLAKAFLLISLNIKLLYSSTTRHNHYTSRGNLCVRNITGKDLTMPLYFGPTKIRFTFVHCTQLMVYSIKKHVDA